MSIGALGYVSIRSDKIEDWAEFGTSFLGLQVVDRTRSALKFRMDDRKQRIIISSEQIAPSVFGWEVENATALDRLAERLEGVKVRVERLDSLTIGLRAIADGIRFEDPSGLQMEAFYGAEVSDTSFKPGRSISGFRTGPLGLGHAVITVTNIEDLLWFYKDTLGFGISDFILQPFKAYFFHVNSRHHSLAMIETDKAGIHHLMMELFNLDDVGQAYDIALSEPDRIRTTLGRHTNDFMTSFYSRTPNDFMVEYGWGGRSIDPAIWDPVEMKHGPSLWGHDRMWLSADKLAEARALRAKLADAGQRHPVQVLDGNFEVSDANCTWWAGLKSASQPEAQSVNEAG